MHGDVSRVNVNMDRLSAIITGLIDKLDHAPAQPVASVGSGGAFSGFHVLSSSEDEAGPCSAPVPDPLDSLVQFTRGDDVDEDFVRALEGFSGPFMVERRSSPDLENMVSVAHIPGSFISL